ncbi:MAG: tetratricopeptide repeat protein [Candidatus Hydrogenedentales bacterium]|jgi:Flp pilus assembly protein TadD
MRHKPMSIQFIRTVSVLFVGAALFVAVSSQAVAQPAPDLLGEARQLLQKAAEEEKASGSAQMNGDFEAAKKHRDAQGAARRDARERFDRARAGESNDIDLLFEYVQLLQQMEDYDLAESTLTRAVSLQPENALAWTELGEAQAARGEKHSADAIRSLRKAASLDAEPETTARAFASLGALYQEIGLYDFSRESLSKALEIKPDHRGAIIALASLDLRNGDVAKASSALDALGTIPELQPFLQHTIERGLIDFDASRRWMPDLPENHLAYAKLLARVGRMGEAVWPLRRCVKMQQDNFVAWNLLGSVYRGLERPQEAREAFEKSLAINPDQPRTRQVLESMKAGQQQPLMMPQETTPAAPPATPSATPPATPEPAPAAGTP